MQAPRGGSLARDVRRRRLHRGRPRRRRPRARPATRPRGRVYEQSLDRGDEFRVLVAARAAGVLVPAARWLSEGAEVLGTPFFLQDRITGETIGRRIVKTPRRRGPREAAGPDGAGARQDPPHRPRRRSDSSRLRRRARALRRTTSRNSTASSTATASRIPRSSSPSRGSRSTRPILWPPGCSCCRSGCARFVLFNRRK